MSNKCYSCDGAGSYEDHHPLGSDSVTCPTCGGTGLTESAQRERVVTEAVDRAWERFLP
jgi:DnaJ-class molecular chaperone